MPPDGRDRGRSLHSPCCARRRQPHRDRKQLRSCPRGDRLPCTLAFPRREGKPACREPSPVDRSESGACVWIVPRYAMRCQKVVEAIYLSLYPTKQDGLFYPRPYFWDNIFARIKRGLQQNLHTDLTLLLPRQPRHGRCTVEKTQGGGFDVSISELSEDRISVKYLQREKNKKNRLVRFKRFV